MIDEVYVLEEVRNSGHSYVVGVFSDREEMHAFKDTQQPDIDSARDPINWRWSSHQIERPAGETDD